MSSSYEDVCLPDQRKASLCKQQYIELVLANAKGAASSGLESSQAPFVAGHAVSAPLAPTPTSQWDLKRIASPQALYPNKEHETFLLSKPPPKWEKQGPGQRLANFFLTS